MFDFFLHMIEYKPILGLQSTATRLAIGFVNLSKVVHKGRILLFSLHYKHLWPLRLILLLISISCSSK